MLRFQKKIRYITQINSQYILLSELVFRVINVETYLENFASDRSHMIITFKNHKGKMHPVYSSPPPSYLSIKNSKLLFFKIIILYAL